MISTKIVDRIHGIEEDAYLHDISGLDYEVHAQTALMKIIAETLGIIADRLDERRERNDG